MGRKVLVIDSSAAIRQQLRFILAGDGYEIEEAPDCRSARQMIAAGEYKFIIADEDAPPDDRDCVQRQLWHSPVHAVVPLLLLSKEEHLGNSVRDGMMRLPKPFSTAALLAAIERMGCGASGMESGGE